MSVFFLTLDATSDAFGHAYNLEYSYVASEHQVQLCKQRIPLKPLQPCIECKFNNFL